MGTHNGRVNHGVFVIRVVRERLEYPLPHSAFTLTPKARVDFPMVTKAGGQVTPRNPHTVTV